MNIFSPSKNHKLIVLFAPHAAREESATLVAELALRGPVTVLDGGKRFIPYRVAQLLRRKTVEVDAVSQLLFIRRAFTCYEMNSLLGDIPNVQHPCLVLDLLNTFYDDHVPTYEADRLLKSCLNQIHRLLRSGLVVVTLSPPLANERDFLIDQVCRMADEVIFKEAPANQPTQLNLF